MSKEGLFIKNKNMIKKIITRIKNLIKKPKKHSNYYHFSFKKGQNWLKFVAWSKNMNILCSRLANDRYIWWIQFFDEDIILWDSLVEGRNIEEHELKRFEKIIFEVLNEK